MSYRIGHLYTKHTQIDTATRLILPPLQHTHMHANLTHTISQAFILSFSPQPPLSTLSLFLLLSGAPPPPPPSLSPSYNRLRCLWCLPLPRPSNGKPETLQRRPRLIIVARTTDTKVPRQCRPERCHVRPRLRPCRPSRPTSPHSSPQVHPPPRPPRTGHRSPRPPGRPKTAPPSPSPPAPPPGSALPSRTVRRVPGCGVGWDVWVCMFAC
jgi:hypothetical protein